MVSDIDSAVISAPKDDSRVKLVVEYELLCYEVLPLLTGKLAFQVGALLCSTSCSPEHNIECGRSGDLAA